MVFCYSTSSRLKPGVTGPWMSRENALPCLQRFPGKKEEAGLPGHREELCLVLTSGSSRVGRTGGSEA